MADPSALLPSDRLELSMGSWKKPLSSAQAIAEANRCIYCHDAPCIQACPTSIDIPEFIRKIATGNLSGSARTILSSNILGLSCGLVCPVEVLCVGDCVFNNEESPPIQIGKLQAHATRWAQDRNITFFEKGESTGKQIACVGGGPASLACAHELVRLGHDAIIYEKLDYPGGLNTNGIAPYKMHADTSLQEIAYISQIGFEIQTNVEIGHDISWQQLLQDNDALFLGMGIGPDTLLDLPGSDLEGVVGALDLIERFKCQSAFDVTKIRRAAVIGAGNTALDVVREMCRLNIPEVRLVYRRGEPNMSGYKHEFLAAKQEGVLRTFHAQPTRFVGENGRLTGLECVQIESPDKNGKTALSPVEGSEFVLPTDLVALAIGQAGVGDMLANIPGIECHRGALVIDPATGQTGHPRVFAGGDLSNGGMEVVNAVEEGKIAARSIDAHLRGDTI